MLLYGFIWVYSELEVKNADFNQKMWQVCICIATIPVMPAQTYNLIHMYIHLYIISNNYTISKTSIVQNSSGTNAQQHIKIKGLVRDYYAVCN